MESYSAEIYAGEGTEEVERLHGVSRVRVCRSSLLLVVHGNRKRESVRDGETERVSSDRKEGQEQKEILCSDTSVKDQIPIFPF